MKVSKLDKATFIFAIAPPLMAIVLALFAAVSDAYVERESIESSNWFERAGLNVSVRSSINDAIKRVAKGALLISNIIVTCVSAGIGLFAAIYFAPNNYFLIFGMISLMVVFIVYVIKLMVRYGVKDLYIQRVRRPFPSPTRSAAFSFTYGKLVESAMVGVNFALLATIILVFMYGQSSLPAGPPHSHPAPPATSTK